MNLDKDISLTLQINYREKVLHKLEHTDQLENIIGKTKNLVTMTIQLLPSEAGHMFKQAKFEGEEMPIMFRTPGHVFTKAVNRGFESALNCGESFVCTLLM
ncbi:hypothetical protein DPMN_096948 [Dreissena polymorpha]|uniref:Uncharacterized protein n=1 Tax=Dreissena polymorpha TaxID=45954 RepID=A0A9D4LA60_DREPO|nr:hypothetical protein DPMN_096948 [Dreissena polymorpha]